MSLWVTLRLLDKNKWNNARRFVEVKSIVSSVWGVETIWWNVFKGEDDLILYVCWLYFPRRIMNLPFTRRGGDLQVEAILGELHIQVIKCIVARQLLIVDISCEDANEHPKTYISLSKFQSLASLGLLYMIQWNEEEELLRAGGGTSRKTKTEPSQLLKCHPILPIWWNCLYFVLYMNSFKRNLHLHSHN